MVILGPFLLIFSNSQGGLSSLTMVLNLSSFVKLVLATLFCKYGEGFFKGAIFTSAPHPTPTQGEELLGEVISLPSAYPVPPLDAGHTHCRLDSSGPLFTPCQWREHMTDT